MLTSDFLTLFCSFVPASDKCDVESECLTFDQYMAAAKELWTSTGLSKSAHVIVTSESKSVLLETVAFPLGTDNGSFPLSFITNHLDVAQDTGYIQDYLRSQKGTSITADQIQLSAMASLKLQLFSGVTLGNCCSNFHLLLKDLLSAGCGASFSNTFQCLQDHENPEFRACCSWDKSIECQSRRNLTIQH